MMMLMWLYDNEYDDDSNDEYKKDDEDEWMR
jgi:hypothetical protein